MKNKLIKNTLINYLSQLLSAAINLYLVAYMVRKIGGEKYGLYVLVLSVVSYSDFFRYGLGTSVIKYIAEYNVNKNRREANELISTSFMLFFVQGVVTAIVLSVVILFFIDSFFNIPQQYTVQVKSLGIIFTVYFLFDLTFAAFNNIMEGLQRYDLLRLTEITKKILLALFITFVIMADYGFEFIGVAYLVSSLLAGITAVIFSYRLVKWEIRFSYISRNMFRQILDFAWPQFLGKLTGFFANRVDVLLIGIFLQPTFITIYQIVYQFYLFVNTALGLLGSAVFPYVSELYSKNKDESIKKLYLVGTRYSMFVSVPLVLGAIVIVKPFIASWVGQEYAQYAYLAQIYLVPVILMTSSALGGQISVGLDIVRYTIKYHLIATIINFFISLILIQKIGVAGVVIGTCVGSLFAWYPASKILLKKLKIGWREFLTVLVFRPIFIAFVVLPALLLLMSAAYPVNMFIMFVYGVCYFVLYVFVYFYFGFNDIERIELKQTIRNNPILKI